MLTRRDFLRFSLGGAAAIAAPTLITDFTGFELPEYRRKVWQVPSTAPVGSLIHRAGATEVAALSYNGINVARHDYVTQGTAWDARIPGQPRTVYLSPRDWEAFQRATKAERERDANDCAVSGVTMVDRVQIRDGHWDLKRVDDELARYGVGRVQRSHARDVVSLEAEIVTSAMTDSAHVHRERALMGYPRGGGFTGAELSWASYKREGA